MARIETTADVGRTRDIVGPGIVAGIAGAVVMGAVAMIVSAVNGTGFFTPVQLIGATYLGVDWANVAVWSTILGLVTHLAIGAAYGVLFVALTRNIESMAAKIAAGLAYGAAVYLFMTFLVMPWANPVMYATIDKGLFFLIHLAYGATLPVALPMRRGAPTARRREAPAR
ncbi:MAG TPA: DUF6789 family protein [Sandaracinaceae bacterium]